MAARVTVKELDAKVTDLETRLDEMAGRVDELEAIVKALHLDAAAAAAAQKPARTRKRRKGRKWTEVEKRAFRVRMLEGRLATAQKDGQTDVIARVQSELVVARDRLEELAQETTGVEEPEATPDESGK